MIQFNEIKQIAQRWNLDNILIEKDYVLGWLLWGIASHSELSKSWILKGGAALKKCYVDTHRYSQDLDFTVLSNANQSIELIKSHLQEVSKTVADASGLDFSIRPLKVSETPNGTIQATIYYKGPRKNPTPTGLKIDISPGEELTHPQVLKHIHHPYQDQFPTNPQVYCYSFEELFAEKIRSIVERQKPSDLYDVIYMFRRDDLHKAPNLIDDIFKQKCLIKGFSAPSYQNIAIEKNRTRLESRWQKMLSNGLGIIPPFSNHWDELSNLFAWLNGEEPETPLISPSEDSVWTPPAIHWDRSEDIDLFNNIIEPIRYAAVNRLQVNLGYQGTNRIVEPYSLRKSSAGNRLFFAFNVTKSEIRSYRISRLESVIVTNIPFAPRFTIEFTNSGETHIPLLQRRKRT